MGGGDFGSNVSVHWRVRRTGAGQPARDVDGVPYGSIGNEHGRNGYFRVTMKYPNEDAARAALAAADFRGNGVVVVYVPKIEPERKVDPARDFPNPAEVTVDW